MVSVRPCVRLSVRPSVRLSNGPSVHRTNVGPAMSQRRPCRSPFTLTEFTISWATYCHHHSPPAYLPLPIYHPPTYPPTPHTRHTGPTRTRLQPLNMVTLTPDTAPADKLRAWGCPLVEDVAGGHTSIGSHLAVVTVRGGGVWCVWVTTKVCAGAPCTRICALARARAFGRQCVFI